MNGEWRPISEKPDDLEFAALYDANHQLITFAYAKETPHWRRRPWIVSLFIRMRLLRPEATHFVPLPAPNLTASADPPTRKEDGH
jgi:hypothetical protein